MKKAVRILCPNCGGSTELLPDGQYRCEYCGTVFQYAEKEDKQSGEQAELLLNASTLRQTLRFDEAADVYRIIIKNYPDELRAYWGAFLSEYGIEYVKDGGKTYPICHRISRLSALESRDLRELFKHCSPSEHESYLCQAEEIERMRQQTYDISCTQEPYDVYVCHGGSQAEWQYAKQLGEGLEAKGLRVFLPSRDIPEHTHNQEAYIFAAIESARCMFVVAGSLESVQKTDNAWRRFISDKSKKFQILHCGLNEQDFPADLRRMLQRQEPISLLDSDWLKRAVTFADDKKKKQAETTPVMDQSFMQQLLRSAEERGRTAATATNLAEAFAVVLSCLTGGNVYDAERAINEQLDSFDPKELRLVAELCLELAKLQRVSESERRSITNNIGLIATRLRTTYPSLTLTERNVYSSIRNPKFLVYLAKCFGVPRDTARQCFVLDLIDCTQLNDTQIINELVGMLFKNNRSEDVKNVLRAVPVMDGNYVLLALLNNFKGDGKNMLLLDVADKIKCSDAVEEELNYSLATCDDLGVALAVVGIMTRNRIPISTMALNGALSHADARGLRTVLQNIGNRSLSGVEVDKLVEIGAENGDDAANEVLSYLWSVAHIEDIGSHNMRLLISKCNLANIKSRLFSFHIDKKLAEQLLTETLRSSSPDRLSNVKVLLEYVPTVDISAYERILLGDDPSKGNLLQLLAPKTGRFASANNVFEKYLLSPADDSQKREILAMYEDFPFSDRVTELYLNLLPNEYDDGYIAKLDKYLSENPAKAREAFVKHYEALAPGYEKVLPVILKSIRSMQDDAIVRFVCDFKGDQELKDKLFMKIIEFSDKPKNIEVTLRDVTCNLAQAYLLTLRGAPTTTAGVMAILRKRGVKEDEKVIYCGKKTKLPDYLAVGNIPPDVVTYAQKFIK